MSSLTASLIVNILLSLRSFRIGLAVDLLVGRHHLVKVLVDLSIFPRHNTPEHCFWDGSSLLGVEHFETFQQLLRWVGRCFIFSVESEKFIETNTLVGLVN